MDQQDSTGEVLFNIPEEAGVTFKRGQQLEVMQIICKSCGAALFRGDGTGNLICIRCHPVEDSREAES